MKFTLMRKVAHGSNPIKIVSVSWGRKRIYLHKKLVIFQGGRDWGNLLKKCCFIYSR
jgi:hypothetical protein